MYSWYEYLNKPFLSPPPYVFAIVWPILYILIAVSLFLFLKDGFRREKLIPFTIFIVQLALNLMWSPIFFGLHNMKLALVVVFLMILLTAIIISYFYKFSKISAILLIPYFLWICFAFYLNLGFILLN